MGRQFARGLSLLAGVTLAVWVGGCGVDERPLAPAAIDEPGAVAQAPQAAAKLIRGSAGSGQPAWGTGVWGQMTYDQTASGSQFWNSLSAGQSARAERLRTDSKMIGPKGGFLRVGYLGGRTGRDDMIAIFTVPKGAMKESKNITMTLKGDDLGDLELVFDPSGFKFEIPARLAIKLGRDLVDGQALDAIVALHYDAAGDLIGDPIVVHLESGRRFVEIYFDVPGFSRYSLGGGS